MLGMIPSMAGRRAVVGVPGTLVALILISCSSVPSLVVESAKYPGVRIECQSDVRITAEACRAWADQMLDVGVRGGGSERIARIVLMARDQARTCSASFYGLGNQLLGVDPAACPIIPGLPPQQPADSPGVVPPSN